MRAVTVASGGTAQLLNSAGGSAPAIVFIMNNSDSSAAIYFLRSASHVTMEISDPLNIYSPTAGTANSTNIYWSTTNSRYELQNNRGSSITYTVFYFTQS